MSGEAKTCGCGRSPTGWCVGWHNLTIEQYNVKLNEYTETQRDAVARRLLTENK